MILLISILACVSVASAIVGLVLREERNAIRERLESLWSTPAKEPGNFAPELAQPFAQRVVAPWLGRAARISKLIPSDTAQISAKLERAGKSASVKPAEFVGSKVVSALVFLTGVLVILILSHKTMHALFLAIFAVLVGYILPDALLERAARNRQRAIRKSLADCFDLLVVTTEAGLGFDGALARIVKKTTGPISDEFRKALQDMSVGRSRTEALRLMAARVGLPELTTLVAAIHQADLLGVSIAQVLRVQTETMRSQRNLRARQEAAKLPVKMLFPLVFFIFPAIFTVILLPGGIAILHALQNH